MWHIVIQAYPVLASVLWNQVLQLRSLVGAPLLVKPYPLISNSVQRQRKENVKNPVSAFPIHGKITWQVWVWGREVSSINSWFEQEMGHGWCRIWTYIVQLVQSCFPDAADVPDNRVLVKINSGPGKINRNLLPRLRLRGIVMYPGVSNTTSVSQ